ncbi:MAG: S9 family peptidase [Anaerolineales bacterium]|jgi:dipeptidyl aminopeptidase/acylaminoacyl peptidase
MAKPHRAPYGSWKSPITAELIAAQTISLGEIALDGSDLYWSEGRPRQGGRYTIIRCSSSGQQVDCLPPEFNARTRVHEYGGGSFGAFDGVLYFVNFSDQHLYRLELGGSPARLSRTDGYRYADFTFDRSRHRLICVREDHTGPGEAVNTLVAVPQSGGDGQVLTEGYNFYSTPRLSPDGQRLAWLCWNHPNMPWDGSELWTADLLPDGGLGEPARIAGGPDESIFQPEWSPSGVLHFVSDLSGWWNLYRKGSSVEALCPMEAEFGRPQWVFGMRSYAFLAEEQILCAYTQNGMWSLARLETNHRQLNRLDLPYSEISDVHFGAGFACFLGGSGHEPPALIKLDPVTARTEVLRRSIEPTIDPGYFSAPQSVEFPTEKGLSAHGIFYPPSNKDYTSPKDERPPLLVMSHGGPTDAAGTALRYRIQYWTSRGFAVLDVNYGGSTGYGRAYRQRLNGNWGLVDVDDCCNGALWLAQQGQVDVHRLAIRGGSAGGYTTLAALTFKKVFNAGASHYGICDLEALARDTHKFESRYLDTMVGPYPARRDLYLARSPIHHTDLLATPLILFQGDEDPVVPPDQAEMMFKAVRAKKIPVAYLLFKGEQHGFRRAENIKRSFEAELYFYSKVFGFETAEAIEPVKIQNL